MIVLIKGSVKYDITLDPSVWIFDDRKLSLEDYLKNDPSKSGLDSESRNSKSPTERSSRKSTLSVSETGSYVMELKFFIERAEPFEEAQSAQLKAADGTSLALLSMTELRNSVLLFSIDGKQIKDKGPVYLFTEPKGIPVKGFASIVIN
ncbi:hypothetical protein QR721_05425 [Aciduricibacillus chroicocephali]|uniref:Peptidyl-prolyl cis-trans isomerase n=1 Tax=Aciduricibacillus chroicocephali TaxID=3054939 RepID=A0ABY9KY41_9BACI|nr:hypothetical protein QR721_05425 [Bacillaceae bacterium 44XB]